MSNPENNYDPAGSTQMFRAFVEEQPPAAQVQRAQGRSKAGLVIGVIVALVVIVGVVALAMK
ncbi:hypothetical protein AB0M29_02325 [Streptomyces sp. NPDC051976]|uniref:hypothetical protein n=1 Tax=Streptomyces sp. NPDC051976 TaxID=3154947 RepID=UPI003443E863